ncbi:hypothetical protein Pmani_012909 [Petrolisthes manimaculis]|uniref:COMM domain-containing protein 5 n=1 Tax=Petrolisthes manimaculis TaxID=1843537 RepID=A0AAE1PW18_9EUCA|nr:hypothetical protein Pmani_012909 [Petrolisthes manimaculis]
MAAPGISQENIVFPARVPPEVKTLVKASKGMDKAFYRKLIKLSLGYLQGSAGDGECEIAVKNLCQAAGATTEQQVMATCVQYAGVVSLLRAALRVNTHTVRQDTFINDLTNLGLSSDFATDLSRVAYSASRNDINKQLVVASPSLPTFAAINWRVEVTISTSWLSRVLEPVVTLRLDKDDKKSCTFEIPLAKFHQLRYTVASLLHQMEALENSPLAKK